MIQIRNKDALILRGETRSIQKARSIVLGTVEHALRAVEAGALLKSKVRVENSKLCAGANFFDLSRYQKLYVVGGGKAAGSMAMTLEKLLGERISEGFVNVPEWDNHKTRIIQTNRARHPFPSESGVAGAKRMLEIAERADKDDLIIALISGGGSSLIPLPRDGVSLRDKQELTNRLLKSGARIEEINAVRKHLSYFKGGWFAKKASPATILNLIISDVVGDSLDAIASGPTVPDPTTFSDSRKVLIRYGLWEKSTLRIRNLVSDGEKGLIAETPKPGDICFKKVYSVILGNSRTAAMAAMKYFQSRGLNTLILTSTLEGEAANAGTVLSSIIKEVALSGGLVSKPAGLVASGETVVTVKGKGCGGRNQELSLSAALRLQGIDGAAIASVSTDGLDGPTDAAGAIVDGKTIERAKQMGMEPEEYLMENDSHGFFSRLGDLIQAGPTGTNVNDIFLAVIL